MDGDLDEFFDEVLSDRERADCWKILEYVEYDSLSPAEAVDYFVVEDNGWKQTDWASRRGVSQQAVSKNVDAARQHLGEDA